VLYITKRPPNSQILYYLAIKNAKSYVIAEKIINLKARFLKLYIEFTNVIFVIFKNAYLGWCLALT